MSRLSPPLAFERRLQLSQAGQLSASGVPTGDDGICGHAVEHRRGQRFTDAGDGESIAVLMS
ncbi:hypothetical protein ACIRVK_35245 [Streptomyces sp. NPDC101152]|uniref:hypothetical protein n=1 Tax=Streptomyces sp. NPDC101152 TaxID=3366116 RepID=UPI0038043AA1